MMEFDGFLIAEKQRHVEETCCWNHLNTVKKPSMLLHLNFKGALFKNARRKNLPPRCLELLHFFSKTKAK